MITAIGEILFDIFPSYKVLGGAPFNFAFHLNKLGIYVSLISKIGKDAEGEDILNFLKKHEFNIENIQIDEAHKTGRVIVDLINPDSHQFNIISDVAYDYIDFNKLKTLSAECKLIYFGSLIQRDNYENIQNFLLQNHSNAKLLYDINLRPDCYNDSIVLESMEKCDVLKLNLEELERIKIICQFKGSDQDFVQFLFDKYHLDMIALTKGKDGSELFTQNAHYISKTYNSKISKSDLQDTVGAGDAYTAILSLGYIYNWMPEKILEIATMFATDICKIKGAIPIDDAFYDKYKNIIKKG